MIDGKIQDFKFLSNLPIFHSSICWFNNEGFVFLSFFQFSTIALKCSITDTVRMGSKLRKVLHFNVITLMWSYDEKKQSWCFSFEPSYQLLLLLLLLLFLLLLLLLLLLLSF